MVRGTRRVDDVDIWGVEGGAEKWGCWCKRD